MATLCIYTAGCSMEQRGKKQRNLHLAHKKRMQMQHQGDPNSLGNSPNKMQTPNPAQYKSSLSKPRTFHQSYAPFSSSSGRFPETKKESNPGPGAYNINTKISNKVAWPDKFGRPDWDSIPAPTRRTFRAEVAEDKEFRKHRNRVAYLSLYYN
ncbi:protein pitchfork [Bombina bombina]|uniref:protein pitchfork n=1 Tax=Bombina bombina TaxID=8345 RepID=UPI00235AB920|nr:protein pitchfork [Bombina bombina]